MKSGTFAGPAVHDTSDTGETPFQGLKALLSAIARATLLAAALTGAPAFSSATSNTWPEPPAPHRNDAAGTSPTVASLQPNPTPNPVRTLPDYALVSKVNRSVNKSTRYIVDEKLYGKSEFWTVARGSGDCEDYALAKRALLLEAGADPSDLRLMSLWTESGEYHLVLAVRTDRGEYVLDARHARPMARQELEALGYRWHLIEEGGRWFAVH